MIKFLTTVERMETICHDSSLNRRRMKISSIFPWWLSPSS